MTDFRNIDEAGFYPCRTLWSIEYNCPVFVVNQSKYGESTENKSYLLIDNKLEEYKETPDENTL